VNVRLLSNLALLSPALLSLAACKNMPEAYAPPDQMAPITMSRTYRITHVINMDDGDAESHFVQDIRGLNGNWRWTGKRPTARVPVRSADNLHLVMDFAIADATFKTTGPVKVTVYVNDKLAASLSCPEPGERHLDTPLPPGLVEPNKDAVIAAEIDKVWVSPTDATELGFILKRIGLTQE
jgi:hypothetical protein